METGEYYEEHGELQGEQEYFGWGEIAVSPALHDENSVDHVNCVRFDASEESLWIGSGNGVLVQDTCPTLETFSMITSHEESIISLKSMGHSVVSLSPSQLCLHYSGCIPSVCCYDEIGDYAAFEFDQRGHRALIGRSGGGITAFDLVAGCPTGNFDTGDQGIVSLCGPISRGALIMGSVDGYLSIFDPRGGRRHEGTLRAHTGGFAAIDAAGDLVATAGYAARMGRVSLESFVKVFDVRMGLRMLTNVPFAPGPAMLRIHPAYSSTLLIAATSGVFTLADASGMSCTPELYCVNTGGDALISCDWSPSGECIAFGGGSGYVHLWAASEEPTASVGGYTPGTPEPKISEPLLHLEEDDSLSGVPPYFPADGGGFASDVGPREKMCIGLGPRVIEPTLLASVKQSDFIGYINNPKFVPGAAPGKCAAAVAELRNQRVQPKGGSEDAEVRRAVRAERRAEVGGIVLPGRYRRVAIKQQTGVKFEEFDFSYYNRTPFSGLENDLANCYTNALLQVLFFIKPVRDLAMTHVPDPDAEFSLLGELSLLFRMLATAGGNVCQASNLLRALRQSKEAAALGLLGGVHGERGSADIEVEAQKDRSLARRAHRLSRFLLEHLSKESSTEEYTGGKDPAELEISQQHQEQEGQSSPQRFSSRIEEIFGVHQRQRTQCLSRPRPDQSKTSRTFQVELQYPSPKERPPLPAIFGAAAGSSGGPSRSSCPEVTNLSAATVAHSRPSFASLLASSLHTTSDMRAWFDEVVSYQMVRQERVPCSLPQVMVIGCGMEEDKGDLAWWLPVPLEEGTESAADGTTAAAVAAMPECENDEMGQNSKKTILKPWLPHAVAVTTNPDAWSVEVVEGTSAQELETKLVPAAPADCCQRAVYELTALVAHVVDVDEAEDAGPEYEGHLLAHVKVPSMYYGAQQESPVTSRPPSRGPASSGEEHLPRPLPQMEEDVEEKVRMYGDDRVAVDAVKTPLEALETPIDKTDAFSTPNKATLTAREDKPAFNWLVFNDFYITPSLEGEVTELYGGQKIPVLLYYTRVDVLQEAVDEAPAPPASVLTPDAFLQLCRAPPIQAHKAGLNPPTFIPLSPAELPFPGMIFALDAEFVAYAPPERVVLRGVECDVRPARLGLGRVSVVRGTGPAAGVTCIDDHIKSVEPVFDHLTRFSGILPGDLDPAQSRHYLTTLRKAYLKLRYMVDAGCVFVGHGLKKDFRMLNIVVPPEQVVDTIDLFYSGRGRRLSLRFLSVYLLGKTIQGGTHDSVEDAVAALQVYQTYNRLVEEGTFESTLTEMFDWGNAHGFDPGTWHIQPHQLAPQQDQMVSESTQTTLGQHEQPGVLSTGRIGPSPPGVWSPRIGPDGGF